MASPKKFFLTYNTLDGRHKVVDENDFAYGDGETKEEAIASARIVTDEPIIWGKNLSQENRIVKSTDAVLDPNSWEFIDTLAELAGVKPICYFDDEFNILGYGWERIE